MNTSRLRRRREDGERNRYSTAGGVVAESRGMTGPLRRLAPRSRSSSSPPCPPRQAQQARRRRPAAQARERLPAAVTTRHALALPGGTLEVEATAGAVVLEGAGRGAGGGDRLRRLHAARGRSGDAAGDLRGQRRAGGGVGLPQHRRDRAVAAADRPGRAGAVAGRRRWCRTPRPGCRSPTSCSSIRSAPGSAG